MDNLTSLIERIEAATEGSRELDAEVYIALNIPPERVGRIDRNGGCVGWWPKDAPYVSSIEVPSYTTSIDAALTLLPEGLDWLVRTGKRADGDQPYGHVFDGARFGIGEAEAATPVLALLAAILRARQAADTEGAK